MPQLWRPHPKSVTHSYDGFNHLTSSVVGTTTITYSYNAQGIRTSRQVGSTYTDYLLDGGNVVCEVTNGTVTTYLRGANLISSGSTYYLYNAHGDVVQLTSFIGAVTKTYDYDAFGNEKNPSSTDTNPFRYCGEYYDTKTGLYYLRARYYDPTIGRFTQEDTHWNTANMIYGDNPQKINEREDALGLKTYSYTPQISAVVQSGNLYVYGVNNPVMYADPNGKQVVTVYFDENRDFSLHMGNYLLGAAVTAMLIDILTADDPPILYAKRENQSNATSKTGVSGSISPMLPLPPDDEDDKSLFKKYSSSEIERKYGLKKNNFHREIKVDILNDLSHSEYSKKLKWVGSNPDIYLSVEGRIMIVSTQYPNRSFVTDLIIQFFLP